MEHGLQFVCCLLLHYGKSARQFLESKLFLKETKYNIQIAHVRESKTVLDSGFHTVNSRFQVLDSRFSQWNLDSGPLSSNRW